jgi:hypothetical protein
MTNDIDGNKEKSPYEAAADLGAIKMEIHRERKYYGEHTKRMAKLKKMAAVQEKVIHRMLDRSIAESDQPKRPHLTIVK